jgi:hypothetical protein
MSPRPRKYTVFHPLGGARTTTWQHVNQFNALHMYTHPGVWLLDPIRVGTCGIMHVDMHERRARDTLHRSCICVQSLLVVR